MNFTRGELLDCFSEDDKQLVAKYYRKIRGYDMGLVTEEELDAVRRYNIQRMKRSPLKCMYYSSKSGAKRRGISFTISYDYFYQLAISTVYCPVFGFELDYSIISGEGAAIKRQNRASLDRIDNEIGYEVGNCWFLSWRANRMKSDFTIDELKTLVLALEVRRDLTNATKPVTLREKIQEHLAIDSTRTSTNKRTLWGST